MANSDISRRRFLKYAAGGAGAAILAGCAAPPPQVIEKVVTQVVEKPVEVEKVVTQVVEKQVEVEKVVTQVVEKQVEKVVTPVFMANVIRTLSNEYHSAWNRGGRLYAESERQGKGYRVLLCEGDSEKQLTMMKALLQEGGKEVVFNIDPNQSPDAKPIADLCKAAGVYFVTQWNKPDDLHPWDYDPFWVCHMGVDGVPSGYYIAQELFKAMGGKGKIVALQGLLANVPAVQRFDGLKKALSENPNIELLADQTAEWDRTKAVGVTEAFLAKYPDLTGIWAANDNMGLGALEALRAAKKNKTIPVAGIDGTSEAIQAVVDGEFAATVMNDPMWQGGMGLALAYQAKNGVFDPSKEPREHREFYFTPVFVGKDNAQKVQQNYVFGIPTYAWDDLWGRVQKQ